MKLINLIHLGIRIHFELFDKSLTNYWNDNHNLLQTN